MAYFQSLLVLACRTSIHRQIIGNVFSLNLTFTNVFILVTFLNVVNGLKNSFWTFLRIWFFFLNVTFRVQMVSIYGQPEQCSEACREILTIMQREATNANRGSVTSLSPPGARFSKNLRKNPKFSVSFSYVYVKFIESYKVKIFTEFSI